MLSFIAENGGTIAVLAIVAAIVILAVRKVILDRRSGNACGSCPSSGDCQCCNTAAKGKKTGV